MNPFLSEHFTNSNVRVSKEQLFFTDWKLTDEGRRFGIQGVEDIKESIKEHLVELNVIGKDDISELESSVSPPRFNHNYCKS